MDQPLIAHRAMLVSQVNWTSGGAPLVLDRPAWIATGERYWLSDDREMLLVETANGSRRSYPCSYASGPDALR